MPLSPANAVAMGPQVATCETDSEGDDAPTRTPTKPSHTTSRRLHSSRGAFTAKKDVKPDVKKRLDKFSDSGYSSGTKTSGESSAAQDMYVASAPMPAEMPPTASKQPSRSPERKSSSKSRVSDHSSKSARAPSKPPSRRSRTSQPEKAEEPHTQDSKRDRSGSRVSETARTTSGRKTSSRTPPPSRDSRAPSTSSREDMPPPPRPRTYTDVSARPAPRPSSFHAGIGPVECYRPQPAYPAYDHGPPPSRSAYQNARPNLAMLTGPVAGYAPHGFSHALQSSAYDSSRMAMRAQADYAAITGLPVYSARRQVQIYDDLPHNGLPKRDPPSPGNSSGQRRLVSARRPACPPPHHEYDLYYSDEETDSDDQDGDDDIYCPARPTMLTRSRSQPVDYAFSARGVSGRGSGTYPSAHATSHYVTQPCSTVPQEHMRQQAYDQYGDTQSDYRSSVRSRETGSTGSSRRRPTSLSSSGDWTKETNNSASSGSARRQSMYARATDPALDAERYMRSMDRQAEHIRTQQPDLTQESLRLSSRTRQVDNKRSDRLSAASVASSKQTSSHRSQSHTVTDGQTVTIRVDTTAGINLQLEGDTEGRPIRLVQQPGGSYAELVIGTGASTRAGGTVCDAGSGSSGQTRETGDRATRVSRETERSRRSSKAAVSGRRERARTMDEF